MIYLASGTQFIMSGADALQPILEGSIYAQTKTQYVAERP